MGMAVYDSAKTRDVAHALNQLSDKLSMDVKPNVRRAEGFRDEFRGEAAKAMNDALERTDRKLTQIIADLEALRCQVNAYADAMDRVDKQLADTL